LKTYTIADATTEFPNTKQKYVTDPQINTRTKTLTPMTTHTTRTQNTSAKRQQNPRTTLPLSQEKESQCNYFVKDKTTTIVNKINFSILNPT